MDYQKYNETVQEWINIVQENAHKDAELTLKYCEEIINYGKETQEDGLVALGYYHEGIVYYVLNEGMHFYEAVTNALSYLSRVEEWELMARCYNFLGIFSVNHGNAAIGLDYYLNALECCKKCENEAFASTVKVNRGVLNIIYGRYDDAIEVLQQALDFYGKHPELPRYDDHMICIYENMAKAYLCKGDLIEAKCCFENIHSEHGDFLEDEIMLTVLATEAMYYHFAGKDDKCQVRIDRIHQALTPNMPIMDMFDDFYDYLKILLERDCKEEFWKLIEIMEPMVRSLDITNLILKILSMKIQFYRKHKMNAEYLQAAALYFEYSERAAVENRTMMNNVLNLRRTLEEVNLEKQEIEEKNVILQAKSETDALTGLSNRFRLNDYSETAFQNALDHGTSLAVEILDMDNFKGYNDYYGHQKGDECIQLIATAIKSMEEFGAFTARYGGDEFVLIYEGKTREELVEYAAELRKRVMNLGIEHQASKISNVMTISQGICWDIPVQGNRMWDYLHAADDMLYRVKQRKRNNFCIGNLTEASDQIIMSYL
ncbi:MAG: GGDEF domain-containing protein [Agathobacter sp.]|nr:GGDEF domain-containing protein [Agathobacter sp.]